MTVVNYLVSTTDQKTVTSGVPQGSILEPLLFIVFFNDISDVIKNSNILTYADGTVIYFASRDIVTINSKLSEDMTFLARWFDENQLIVNLKPGKTESLLFGTAQKLSKKNISLSIMYNQVEVMNTKTYRYLGVDLTSSLNLSTYFDRCYKRASARLRLLNRIRSNRTLSAAKTIYMSMIVPTLTYCGILNLNMTRTQLDKLASFHTRVLKGV